MGHVNNTVFGVYFEIGRSTYLSENGFYGQDQVGFVIVKTEITFRGMILWPGRVTIGTRVGRVGTSSFDMEQLLMQDDRIVGSAMSTMVVIDLETNSATPIPDAIRAVLNA